MGNFSAQNIAQNAFQSEPGGDIFTKKICIIDTCIILSRPQIINTILKSKRYHKVVVPEVVIKELNYQKDHGDTDSIRQKAWLAMKTIQEKKDSIIIEQCEKSEDKNNDEKIMWIAKQYSCKNYIVELLTDDIYFSLNPELSSCKNISVLLIRDLDKILCEKDEYSNEDTQKFIHDVWFVLC